MKFITIISILLIITTLYGAGFSTPEQSARAISMGNAYTAISDDPTAIFYNPAGIYQIDKIESSIGVTWLHPKNSWKNGDKKENTKLANYYMPQIYIGGKLNKKFSIGFGVSAPYAIGIEWPDNWEGAELIEKMELQIVHLSPAFAFEIFKNFMFGFTYDFTLAGVELKKRTNLGEEESIIAKMSSDDIAIGHSFKIGFIYKFKNFKAGLTYKFGQKIEFSGNADFDVTNDTFSSVKPKDQKMTTSLNLPHFISLGLAYDIIPNRLLISFDLNYTLWSNYEQLKLEFEEGIPEKEVVTEKNWEDVFAFRFGVEYKHKGLAFRGGYVYDISPIPDSTIDPSLPGSDRHIINFGFGYNFQNISFDLSYSYLKFIERYSDNDHLQGSYNGDVNIVSLTISKKW